MSSKRETIQIGEHPVERLYWKEQPVATFEMIAQVHSTPIKTIRDAFNRNRKRFAESKDYFRLDFTEASSLLRNTVANSQGLLVLTRAGYLLLVKPLRDEKSWKVQAQMIDEYFALLEEHKSGFIEILTSEKRVSPNAYIETAEGEKIYLAKIPHTLWQVESEMRGLELYQRESKRYRLHGNEMSKVAHVWVPDIVLDHIRAHKPEHDTVGQWMIPQIRLPILFQLVGAAKMAALVAKQENHHSLQAQKARYDELREMYTANIGITAEIPGTAQQVRVLGPGKCLIEQRQLGLFDSNLFGKA